MEPPSFVHEETVFEGRDYAGSGKGRRVPAAGGDMGSTAQEKDGRTYGSLDLSVSVEEEGTNLIGRVVLQKQDLPWWRVLRNHLQTSFVDYQAHAYVVAYHLLSVDLLFYCLIITASTLIFKQNGWGLNLSWTFLSLIVVFPITWNISEAYKRREAALSALAKYKALVFNIFVAHRDWVSTCAAAREGVGSAHFNHVRQLLSQMSELIGEYLLVPVTNNTRHLYTGRGRAERNQLRPLIREHVRRVLLILNGLSLAAEDLKRLGLTATEASRLNQYNMLLLEEFEMMRIIKGYRTPEGIRAFARLFILIHPIFYGAYYADLAEQTSVGFALSLAYVLGGAMIALLNVEVAMEDPFDPRGLDNVRVQKKMEDLARMLAVEDIPEEEWLAGAEPECYRVVSLQNLDVPELTKLRVSLERSVFAR